MCSSVLPILLFASARTVVLIKAALGVSPCEGLREGCFHWSHVVGPGSTVWLFSDYTVHFVKHWIYSMGKNLMCNNNFSMLHFGPEHNRAFRHV